MDYGNFTRLSQHAFACFDLIKYHCIDIYILRFLIAIYILYENAIISLLLSCRVLLFGFFCFSRRLLRMVDVEDRFCRAVVPLEKFERRNLFMFVLRVCSA